jgi:hypothetical protein
VHRAGLASVLTVSVSLLAGCGSSSTNSATVTTAANGAARAAFAAKADAICTKLRQTQAPSITRAAALEEADESASRRSALASVMRKGAAMARAADAKIAAIPRPPESEPAVEKLLAGYAEEVAELGKLADAIEAVDGPGIQSARAQLAKVKAQDRALAKSLGLKVCSQPRT